MSSAVSNDAKATSPAGSNKGRASSIRSKKVAISDKRETMNGTLGGTKGQTGGALAQTGASDANATKNLLTKKASKPAYLQSLNESEKAENFKIIDNMNKKISYLKNPRHKKNVAPILMTAAIKDAGAVEKVQKDTSFRVEPTLVQFMDYQVNGVYEIDVKCTNMTKVSKRIKFIPPATEFFTIRKVKFPSDKTGDVAPGMSLTLAVTFQAPSFADFDDFLTFITEENSFKIPLRARRDPPSINLVNPMDCLNSWLGDRVDMAFRCVNNGGDGGFKFFCEKDEDDSKQTDDDAIRIGSFNITPSEFYLYSGNAIDVYVSFTPEAEGQLNENLILACDNQTSEFYKVTGYGAMLDLDIVSVDGKEVDFKANPFETMYFDNTNPTSESRRTVMIKNGSPIGVPFHWSIFKQKNSNKINLADEQTHYRISPAQGKIQPGQTMEFEIFFCPQHAEPYFEFCDMIVEDIPIAAVRDPPEGLKSFAAQATTAVKAKVPMPTYVGSNTQFLSIPMVQFNLRGQGNSCQVTVEPPIAFFEGDTFINHEYRQTVQLRKLTQGVVKYSLRMESKNRDSFDVDVRTEDGKALSECDNLIEGLIGSQGHIALDINISSAEVGKALAYFYIEIEDGPPVSFSCQANFRGPIVHIVEPVIDLGLAKVNTNQTFTVTLENQCPVAAQYIIKSCKNKKMTFENAIDQSQNMSTVNDSQTSLMTSQVIGRPIYTKSGNIVNVDTPSKTLQPNERTSVRIHLDCIKQESIEEYFEIMIKNSKSLSFQLLGEVQVPKVYLNRQEIELGKIYAGVKEVIDHEVGKHKSQSLELVNYGNLPVHFKWEEIEDPQRVIAHFEPHRGTIPPKSKVKISCEMTVYMGGQIDELFLCDIQDMELPLGFEMKADAFGLNVAYLTNEEQTGQSSLSTHQDELTDEQQQACGNMNRLQMFNFLQCTINKPTKTTFFLKNLSGISTKFQLNALTFEPKSHIAPQQKSEVQIAMEAQAARLKAEQEAAALEQNMSKKRNKDGGKQIRFAASAKGQSTLGATAVKTRTMAILSDEHEQTQKFTSATGNTFTQTKKFEKEQNFFLSNNKGLAVVFSPHEGELPANAEVPITVTLFNNVCGKFDDKIVASVNGLNKVEFPVRVNISGSPVVIPQNQVGLNYNTEIPSLPMPTIVANSQPISKTFKIKNTGIRILQIDWRIFDKKDLDELTNDSFKLSIMKNQSFDKKKYPFKFNFSAVEPEESKSSAFEITPKNIAMGPRSIQEFKVTFDPSAGTGSFDSIMMASPEVSAEEIEIAEDPEDLPKKGTLGIISLGLNASTITPRLSLDKTDRMDGHKHIKMRYWAIPEDQNAPSKIQKLTFSNDSKADMIFNLNVSGPFQIVKTKSNTGAKHPLAASAPPSKVVQSKVETMFCLQPLKIVEVHVKFLAPKPSELQEWPMIMKNEREGGLSAFFSNGETQKFFIDGELLRPKLTLLTEKKSKNDLAMDEMDFGVCNVDRARTIKLFLSNITEVTANWSLNYVKFPKKQTVSKYTTTLWEEENLQKVDDPDVFEFSVATGALRGKSLPLRKIPEGMIPPVPKDQEERQFLPQTLLVNFRPKKNVLYKSKFRFTVENGLACDVILKGKGSYEENHD